MRFEIIEMHDNVVDGIIRAGGRDLAKDSHGFMERYMRSQPGPCTEKICVVENWVVGRGQVVPGKYELGDWLLSFTVKDPALLESLRSGQQMIGLEKNAKGLIEFNINNVKKCVKVNKNMSETSAAEQIDNLASGLIAKAGNTLDPISARIRIRKEHPDLARREAEEYRIEQLERTGLVRKASEEEEAVAEELDRIAQDRMKLDPSLSVAEAAEAARRQRPDLVVRIDAQRRAMVADAEESARKDMEKAAEEVEQLALLLMERTSFDIAEARAKIRAQRPDLAAREAGRTIAKSQVSRFVS